MTYFTDSAETAEEATVLLNEFLDKYPRDRFTADILDPGTAKNPTPLFIVTATVWECQA